MTAAKHLTHLRTRIVRVASPISFAAAISCATTTTRLRTAQLPTAGGDGQGYRFEKLAGGKDENKLFVCLALSGRGTRAAALAYGAMLALRQTHIDWPRPGETLVNEVDCISSVSGGSFPVAYYAFITISFSRILRAGFYIATSRGAFFSRLFPHGTGFGLRLLITAELI